MVPSLRMTNESLECVSFGRRETFGSFAFNQTPAIQSAGIVATRPAAKDREPDAEGTVIIRD